MKTGCDTSIDVLLHLTLNNARPHTYRNLNSSASASGTQKRGSAILRVPLALLWNSIRAVSERHQIPGTIKQSPDPIPSSFLLPYLLSMIAEQEPASLGQAIGERAPQSILGKKKPPGTTAPIGPRGGVKGMVLELARLT